MAAHLDLLARELERHPDRRRDFLEIGRCAGQFPKAIARARPDDEKVVSVWCSNDYLGMGQHPSVLNAMRAALDEFGAGSGGSRNIGGTNRYHVELELELAELHGKESALIFSSGYGANEGSLSVIAERLGDAIAFSDAANHASIIDGLRHSRVEKRIFRHNDITQLADLLAAADADRPKLVVLESVYSMSGDVAPLAEVVELARRYDALIYDDEVHAVGMYGPGGAGIAARDGVAGDVTVVMGTLAKAFGTAGGYIAGPAVVIDLVSAFARSFIFTTSLPPVVAAGALAAVRHLRSCDEERRRLGANAVALHRNLGQMGIPVASGQSHIVAAVVGENSLCQKASQVLLDNHGIYVTAMNAPSVREGEEILRIAPSATHSAADVEDFTRALGEVWEELGLPRHRD
jgi:5-aminolevulinate synthase